LRLQPSSSPSEVGTAHAEGGDMTGTFGRGVLQRLRQPIARNLTAATITFVATIAISVAMIVRWPGGAPLAVAIAGLFAAIAAVIGVSILLDRRNPYFRTREEVEQVLRLPVLAVCPPRRDR
jgi:hypothetical protein